MYYAGHWEGGRGNFNHSHQWDRDGRRDEGRYRSRNGDHDRDDHDQRR
jgi:hypothetical protein